mgnify:CR=1 FL=1|jgi:hypothetical protein
MRVLLVGLAIVFPFGVAIGFPFFFQPADEVFQAAREAKKVDPTPTQTVRNIHKRVKLLEKQAKVLNDFGKAAKGINELRLESDPFGFRKFNPFRSQKKKD